MSILCAQWGYSRQAYYKDLRCMKEMYYINDQVLAVIGAIRSRQPRVGGLKLWQMLNKGGIPVGRDKVFRLLGEKGLLVKHVQDDNLSFVDKTGETVLSAILFPCILSKSIFNSLKSLGKNKIHLLLVQIFYNEID